MAGPGNSGSAVLGVGMGFTQAPATESIMSAVPGQKAGIASAVNGATRLFAGTLGAAVIGSVAASLYASRLAALLPPGRHALRQRTPSAPFFLPMPHALLCSALADAAATPSRGLRFK
jgi:hypothetical protein